MENIENLIEHNIFFTPVNEDRTSYISNDNFSINVAYISKEIMLRKQNNNQLEDLFNRIDPFLYYLASKYQKYKENNQYEAFFQVDFSFGDPNTNHTYSKVKKITACECVDGDISVLDKSIENTRTFFSPHSIIGELFQIRIFLRADYYKEEVEEESEAEGESEVEDESEEEETEDDLVVVSKPFKTDQCVVCLSKEPSVLFLECLHYCVCLECEEANPFRKCPSCRKSIETKVMI